MQDLRIILRDLGGGILICGFALIIPVLVSLLLGEPFSIWRSYLLSCLIGICLGSSLYFPLRASPDTQLKHALVTSAILWMSIAIIASIPLRLILRMGFLDCVFESISGWTGTGLSLIPDPSKIPASLQFFRSFLQWLGGLGIIVLMLSVLIRPGSAAHALYKAEAREELIRPSIVSTARWLWWIFLMLTGISIGIFHLSGMNIWESINHGLTGIATGGFSVVPGSLGYYENPKMEMAAIIVIILGAIPFMLYYHLLRGNPSGFFRDPQFRFLIAIILVGISILGLINLRDLIRDPWKIRPLGFQYISAITAAGFQTADIASWSDSSKLWISLGMIIGGAAGSTSGGIKLVRALLILKSLSWYLRRMLIPPRGVIVFKLGDRSLSSEQASLIIAEAQLIVLLWILLLGVGAITLMQATGASLADAIFETASAQSNVGLSIGLVSPELHPAAKLMLILNMWLGRLEIIPVLMLIRACLKGFRL